MESIQDDFEYDEGDGIHQVGILLKKPLWRLADCSGSQDEEQVQPYTSKIEPMTGEKRQRDDNDQNNTPHPSSRSNSGSGSGIPNGNYMSNVGNSGQVQSMSGYDALYIGDLQWVCCFVICPDVFLKALFNSSVDDRRRSAPSCTELRCER